MRSLAVKFAVAAVALACAAGGFAQAPAKESPKAGEGRKISKAGKVKAKHSQKPVEAPVQVPPPEPVVPLRPEQMPPTAPRVTYESGQLTIVAQNSTLSSILNAVKARTGAQVEMPGDTANDRVAVKLGPGNPRDVLASLLEGSRWDYIVLGSAADPDAVSQVILTPRRGGGASAAVAATSQPPGAMSVGQQSPQLRGAPFGGGVARPEINAEEDEPAAEPEPPEPAPATQPQINPPPVAPPGAPGPPQTPPSTPGQVKTPAQLLQELQRIQQQQQQQQQQQRPPQ